MTLKEVAWIGSSNKDLKEFPCRVQREIGFALHQVQEGKHSMHAKPLRGLDGGVMEVVCDYNTNTYRAVYAVKLGDRIYVLHAFQKKSKSGIKTPKREIDLIKQRLATAKAYENQRCAMKKKAEYEVELGSGNVFKDLGFKNAEEMQAKAALASEIVSIIHKNKWKQTEAGEALGLPQSKISLLTRGQLSGFSIERLMKLLNKLNRNIEIVVHEKAQPRQKFGHISVVYAAV